MRTFLFLAGAALGAMAMPATAAELVTNGSFEDAGAFPSTMVTSWDVYAGAGDQIRISDANHSYGFFGFPGTAASLSNKFITFGEGQTGVNNSSISQVLAGGTGLYTVSFGVGAVGAHSQQIIGMVIDNISGSVINSLTVVKDAGTNWDTMFSDYSFNYAGTGQGVTLLFTAFGSDTIDADALLDNVSVTGGDQAAAPIPEPATWAMMVCGFGLAGAAMRRRTKVVFA